MQKYEHFDHDDPDDHGYHEGDDDSDDDEDGDGVHPNSHKHFIPYMDFCAEINYLLAQY